MVAAQTPTIAKIKNQASETDARALLYIAVCEVCDFFNVGKNMNDLQIALTVDLIIERFWHLRLEEIKFCFRRAMTRERLFDRLDGNIIIGWITEYDAERTEEAMRISEQKETQELNESRDRPDAIGFEAYLANLKERAKTDPDAAALLKEIDAQPQIGVALSREERAQKDHDFRMWRTFDYLPRKQQKQ